MTDRVVVKKPVFQGTTPRITFTIKDEDGIGFQPETLVLSIYDYDDSVDPPTDSLINSRNDVDVLAACDSGGNVAYWLTAADTDLDVPDRETAICPQRRLLFVWTWDAGAKVGAHEIIIPIRPNRETVAS